MAGGIRALIFLAGLLLLSACNEEKSNPEVNSYRLGDPQWKWEMPSGQWVANKDGGLSQTAAEGTAIALAGDSEWKDYALSSQVVLTGGEFQAGFVFRYLSPDDYYYLIVRSESFAYSAPKLELFRKLAGIASPMGSADLAIPDRQAIAVRIEAAGNRIRVFAGDAGKPLIETQDAAITKGKAGVLTLMSEAKFGPTDVVPMALSYSAPLPGKEYDKKLWKVTQNDSSYDRTFVAPSSGDVEISGEASFKADGLNSNAKLNIWLNDQSVWPLPESEAVWRGDSDEPAAYAIQSRLRIAAGDRLSFRIEGDAPGANVVWAPVITYGEPTAESLHFRHPEHEIGDVHPYATGDGKLYMYYLKPGGKYEAALLTSNDRLRYEEAALTLNRDASVPPVKPWFVLGVFYDEQEGIYRSYSGTDGNVMRSTYSEDMFTWHAAGAEYDIPPQAGYSVQRDPFVFRNEDDGQYWAVMTCRKGGDQNGPEGSVCYAVSPDLKQWTGMGDLYAPGNIGDPEVPQMFKHKDKWYLIFSVYDRRVGQTTCLVSDSPAGPWKEAGKQSLDGEDLAAAQITAADRDRLLLFGWIPLKDTETVGHQHWGGDIALPRELVQRPDGLFDVRLPDDVSEAIRGGQWPLPKKLPTASSAKGGIEAALPGRYDRFDLSFEWQPSADAAVGGIRIQNDGAPETVTVQLDFQAGLLRIRTGEAVHSELQVGVQRAEPVQVRLIVEADIAELFVNGRYALAARLMTPVRQASLSLLDERKSSLSAEDVFRNVKLYRLKGRNELGK